MKKLIEIKNKNQCLLEKRMPLRLLSAAVILYGSLFSGVTSADSETEDNNDFSTRNIFAAGVNVINASLDIPSLSTPGLTPADADIVINSTLQKGAVDIHDLTGQAPGASFFAAIDNTVSSVDTFFGMFDESGNVIETNDDASPFGDGYGDALNGNVNADGSVRFKVTGCCDYDFLGAHDETGEYNLLVFFGVDFYTDIDFLSFQGLTPGEALRAEIFSTDSAFDTALGWFDETGTLLESDDDGAGGLLSRLNVIVPNNGILNFAVTGYENSDFDGTLHTQVGEYQLALGPVINEVPVPAAVWLFGSGLLGLIGVAQRKKA